MELLKKGLIVSFSSLTSVFRILPSLIIERQEIDYAMQVLEDSLRKVKV
jgi:4-aminobutyrate aminotransferase-like enzyme